MMPSYTTCPACHYTRKPTDNVPEWECPNCQKVYAKITVAQGAEELTEIIPPANDNRRFRPLPDTPGKGIGGACSTQLRSPPGMRFVSILAILFGVFLVFSLRPQDDKPVLLLLAAAFIMAGARLLIKGVSVDSSDTSVTTKVIVFVFCMAIGILTTAMSFQTVHIELNRESNGPVNGRVTKTFFGFYKVIDKYSGVNKAVIIRSESISDRRGCNLMLTDDSGDRRIFFGFMQDLQIILGLERTLNSFLSNQNSPVFRVDVKTNSGGIGVFGAFLDFIAFCIFASIIDDLRKRNKGSHLDLGQRQN